MFSCIIESLEYRQLLSAPFEPAALDIIEAPAAIHESADAQRLRYPNLKGTWNGSRSLSAFSDHLALTMKITRQSGNRFSGQITSPEDREIRVNIAGQFISR